MALALSDRVTPASAAAITIAASKDNTLYEDPAGLVSNGAGSYFFTGRTMVGVIHRSVIAFDVAGNVPAGATITGVTLTLHMSRSANDTARTTQLLPLVASWGEGTSNADQQPGQGAPATTEDATWIHRFYDTTLWTAAGADFSPGVSAATSVAGIGTYTWSSAEMAADVQAWLNSPATNFGWLIRGDESAPGTSKRFDSRQNDQSMNRPTLSITYTTGTATSTATVTTTPTPSPTPSPTPTASPTPSPTPTPSPSLTPSPTSAANRRQGDVNCDGNVLENDAVLLLAFVALLPDGVTESGCPDIGDPESISGFDWGDVNCDGLVNAKDALYDLAYRAGIALPQNAQNCFSIGSLIT